MEYILIKQPNRKGFAELKNGGVVDLNYATSKTRRGRVQEYGDITPTICAENPEICKVERRFNVETQKNEYRIRKLTEKECWRLMCFKDSDFEKAAQVNSKTQLYREAGNSICRNVLMAIFSQMGIKGVKKWNDMTDDERYKMIYGVDISDKRTDDDSDTGCLKNPDSDDRYIFRRRF